MGRWLDAFAETVEATAWRPDLWGGASCSGPRMRR